MGFQKGILEKNLLRTLLEFIVSDLTLRPFIKSMDRLAFDPWIALVIPVWKFAPPRGHLGFGVFWIHVKE